MLTEEQEKALLEEIDKLRQDKAALISRVASLEQSLYWLRKKVFGRMSEKNLPLDPNQLFLFSKEEMSSMEISRMEDEVRKSDEEITRTIKVKEKPSRKPLDTSSLPVEVVDLYPEGTTDGEGRLKDDFIEIGKEENSRLERVPAKVYILKTVRHKVIRKSDMEKYPEERQILIHPLPLVPVSKCMAGASVLTDIIIGKLYKIESEANEAGLTAEERKEKRISESYPLILEFEKWLQDAYLRVLPKSRMGKAIEYMYTLLPRLSRYVNDGRIEIDDNRIENAIRPLALGRKNYLFCGNDASAYRAAIVYSLIATCKSAEVDPRIWMEDVLSKIPYYERDEKNMEELLPRNWAKSNQTCSE